MLKVLIVKNNVKVEIADDIQASQEFFNKKFKVPVTIDIHPVEYTFPLQTTLFKEGDNGRGETLKWYGLTGIKGVISALEVGKGYDAVIFIYDVSSTNFEPSEGSYLTSWSTYSPLYPTTEWIELRTDKFDDDTKWIWKAITHEVMHAVCKKIQRMGRNVLDEMDMTSDGVSYFHNDDPYYPGGNYERTLNNIEPYWDLFKPKKDIVAILQRRKDNGQQTEGRLVVYKKDTDTLFTCETIELAYKNNQTSVSCIPTGEYQVKWTYSPKFQKYTYEVTNVPGRSGIRFHPANYARSLEGCIALGDTFKDIDKDGLLDVVNSTITVKKMEDFMERVPFKLIVL